VNCPACSRELDAQGGCAFCAQPQALSKAPDALGGDAFVEVRPGSRKGWLRPVFFLALTLVCWILVFFLNYVRAQRWAGVMNAESVGYMLGGCIAAGLLGWLVAFLVNRARKKKFSIAGKSVFIAGMAVVLSLFSVSGEHGDSDFRTKAHRKIGHLLKEAAGEEPVRADSDWYDGPTRQFYADILSFNRDYVKALDIPHRTSLKRLYTTESYASRKSMEKTVEELRAILDVDTEYGSFEPLFSKFEAGIRATTARDREKEDFIAGVHSSSQEMFALRDKSFQTEEQWLQSSIDLYEFTSAHSGDYSVRAGKLIFRPGTSLAEFQEKQAKAIGLRDAAVDAKHKLEDARKASLSKIGLTENDLPVHSDGK
jgi:hypothetical protein